MSAYIYFFIGRNGTYLPIGTFSRNNVIFTEFHDRVPYGNYTHIDTEMLNQARSRCNESINHYKGKLDEYEDLKNRIPTFNNSIGEKMEEIARCNENIDEIKYLINEEEYALHFFDFLECLLDEARWRDNFDENNYVFAGVECNIPGVNDEND